MCFWRKHVGCNQLKHTQSNGWAKQKMNGYVYRTLRGSQRHRAKYNSAEDSRVYTKSYGLTSTAELTDEGKGVGRLYTYER